MNYYKNRVERTKKKIKFFNSTDHRSHYRYNDIIFRLCFAPFIALVSETVYNYYLTAMSVNVYWDRLIFDNNRIDKIGTCNNYHRHRCHYSR